MSEKWLPVPGHPGYLVSDQGRIRSVDRSMQCRNGQVQRYKGQILKPFLSGGKGRKKYLRVRLTRGSKHSVHQLVAWAFIGLQPPGLLVCHNDDDQLNNHVSNLRYDTPAANIEDCVRNGIWDSRHREICPSGHVIAGENLDQVFLKRTGWRACTSCRRARGYCHWHKCPERLEEMKAHYYRRFMPDDEARAA